MIPSKFSFKQAPDIKRRAGKLIKGLGLDGIKIKRVFFFRSEGSKSRAYARTWGLPKLWQTALNIESAYIIEVISHYFDKLSETDQDKVIIHELSHIPKTFSGALLPHTRRRKGNFHNKVDKLIERYFENLRSMR